MPEQETLVRHPFFPFAVSDTFPLACSHPQGPTDWVFLPRQVKLTMVKEKIHDPWWVEVRQERA